MQLVYLGMQPSLPKSLAVKMHGPGEEERKNAAAMGFYHKEIYAYHDFNIAQSLSHLAGDVANFGPSNPLTCLNPNLDGIDPDDAFSAVPYEKGLALLNYLAQVVGSRAAFEGFARAYIGAFRYRTLTSADFREFFLGWCESREIDASAVDWEAWFHSPGMPPCVAEYTDTLGAKCASLPSKEICTARHDQQPQTVQLLCGCPLFPCCLEEDIGRICACRSPMPPDEDRRHSLLKMLPGGMSVEMIGKAHINQSFQDLEDWVRVQDEFVQDYGPKRAMHSLEAAHPTYALEHESPPPLECDEEDDEEELSEEVLAAMTTSELNAFTRGRQARTGGGWQQQGRGRSLTRKPPGREF